MIRWTLVVALLALGACNGIDPHRMPYWTQPGGDPSAIRQYGTNPYSAPDAPSFNSNGIGKGA